MLDIDKAFNLNQPKEFVPIVSDVTRFKQDLGYTERPVDQRRWIRNVYLDTLIINPVSSWNWTKDVQLTISPSSVKKVWNINHKVYATSWVVRIWIWESWTYAISADLADWIATANEWQVRIISWSFLIIGNTKKSIERGDAYLTCFWTYNFLLWDVISISAKSDTINELATLTISLIKLS